MTASVLAILAFLIVNLLFALRLRRAGPASSGDFILAGRRLGGFALLASLAASNLSAFTIFGVSGAAYRSGWAFFPVMGFGTGLMALGFFSLGLPLRRRAALGGWTSPSHFIGSQTGSPWLGRLFSALSLFYTLPYLAIQSGSAGSLLASLTGMPAALGSALIAFLIGGYVFGGGLRSVVRTDILQFIALMGLGISAFIIISRFAGGQDAWRLLAADTGPAGPNARSGIGGSQGMLSLAGFYLLWSLANPMFPHFTQRFFAARSDRDLTRAMIAYPFVSMLIFFPMTAIGVLGSRLLPGLSGPAADSIFSLLATTIAPVWGPVFGIAALAALMSTMDSQVLSCASILVVDFLPAKAQSGRSIGLAGLLLCAAAWVISLRPPLSILGFLNSLAFPGYASLAPVAFAALYLGRPETSSQQEPRAAAWELDRQRAIAISCAAGLLTGTLLVLAQAAFWRPPLPAAIFNLLCQLTVMLTAYRLGRPLRPLLRGEAMTRHSLLLAGMAAALLWLLGLDWWNLGGTAEVRMWGMLPAWLWYHLAMLPIMGLVFTCLAALARHGARLRLTGHPSSDAGSPA